MNFHKISCIIIDDDENDRALFKDRIEKYFSDTLEIKGYAESVKEGVELIKKTDPEIVFLDIVMPIENGFKLFDYFTSYKFEVIFVTSFKHYAIDAIKYSALDYLVKPINFLHLSETLLRFKRNRHANSSQKRIEAFIYNFNNGVDMGMKVAFPILDGYQMEKLNDIIYCEGDGNYTKVNLADGRVLLVSRTLKDVEELLFSQYFFRIHKSFLVNMNYVKSFSRTGKDVQLDNTIKLPVSTRKHDEFVTVLTKWRKIPVNLKP
jgi:two-component system, LytTR family, response regulator